VHSLTSSVLVSVYHCVEPEALRQCLASLKAQTRQPDQIVIVIDGEVSTALSELIDGFQNSNSDQTCLVPLAVNGGLITALNTGLWHCSGDWILRVDADDIALPHRFERQLGLLEEDSNIDVLGSAMLEFESDPRKPDRLKPVLESHDEIANSIGIRNPINHPTVCIRKRFLEEAGGYPELELLEDYFLWGKLLKLGATFRNLPEPLYLFRFDDQTLQRRGGASNLDNEVWLRRWMYREKLISLPTLCFATMLQIVLRLAPLNIRRFLWRRSRQIATHSIELPQDI
jgi:glycosyltransferase involved in cell wall biosynthesis